ncbi:probable aconitase family protein [Cephalotrichum gorgonifer]|uniref:Probable aconitase family protein n=1 Tax=Cephalotrichum gorgonifer TaxID=2041049 RepID=A0AAE8SZK8_9PEZI|nr:probable aconitase family protein [Cephalotrichum gorgonifer]
MGVLENVQTPVRSPNKMLAPLILGLVEDIRGLSLGDHSFASQGSPSDIIEEISRPLQTLGYTREAEALRNVIQICQTSSNHGGLLPSESDGPAEVFGSEITFLVSAWLESLNSEDRAAHQIVPSPTRPANRRPMTLTEKIFAMHDIGRRGVVCPGETIRVSVDWIMASEASWSGMERTYNQLGKPGIFRNDRFWLAGDHVVDPRVRDHPTVKRLIDSSERAKKVFKMTEYQGMNYTIMHTEFYRERAQPGSLVIGSDSHTCSSGAVGCLAIGLGAADVTMALVTGEIWFKVPECINIKLVGQPSRGIGGKDVILFILQQLRRNTVASERVVEYTGPGLEYLSLDARFAIANMTTEFGGITGIFVPDAITSTFINSRRLPRHKNASNYFRPDEHATYVETHTIDLSQAHSFVAKYPNPDDVVSVAEMATTALDGCFIGACTTAEEDLILGALVLEQGLKKGLVPVAHGKRKVVPGSRPILDMLRKTGLAGIYEDAGFEIGVPGCSYCVGMSADKAGPGEVWLSSQNRNFENRMGTGSIGNLASAATVAASSFDMKITDPQPLIDLIDQVRWDQLKGRGSLRSVTPRGSEPRYVEPCGLDNDHRDTPGVGTTLSSSGPSPNGPLSFQEGEEIISGKVNRLGDFIDTDALAPAQFLVDAKSNEELGTHCLEYTHPEFRSRVAEGFNIVVAGTGFGCGSSREQAVLALLGCGVKCVIARSFAFIYSRNQPNFGLLGITVTEDEFFAAAKDGDDISVDLARNVIVVGGVEFGFELSRIEKELIGLGGISPAFMKFGKQLFQELCSTPPALRNGRMLRNHEPKGTVGGCSSATGLQW